MRFGVEEKDSFSAVVENKHWINLSINHSAAFFFGGGAGAGTAVAIWRCCVQREGGFNLDTRVVWSRGQTGRNWIEIGYRDGSSCLLEGGDGGGDGMILSHIGRSNGRHGSVHEGRHILKRGKQQSNLLNIRAMDEGQFLH